MDNKKYSFRIYTEHSPPKKTGKKGRKKKTTTKRNKPCIAHRREKIL